MIKRTIERKIKEWEDNKIKEPLMLIGARQTGKTFILDYFCKNNYKKYIYINLEKDKQYLEFFEETIDPKELISKIEIYNQEKIDPENSVIFIDEIQISEKAINSLKYFCESNINYRIVVAGSLLGVKINRFKSSFPVGKVKIINLYPITFEEFLEATENLLLKEEIEKCYIKNKRISEPLHRKALKLYNDYLYVGGMPQAVMNYLYHNQDLVLFDREIQKNIINAYIADMAKYTDGSEAIKTTRVYNSIPAQLAKPNKKFMYKKIEESARKKNYISSIDWLIQSGLLIKVNKIKTPEIPLKAYEEENNFKLYLGDVGLLSNMCDITTEDIIKESINMFKGVMSENYIATTLKANEENLNFWESDSIAEVDFIVSIKGEIIPIEVKSSENTRSRSLKVYTEKYNPSYSIRISGKNFGFKDDIKSVPLYAAYLIGKTNDKEQRR